MNGESETFNSFVIKGILANNEFGITKVNELKSIQSVVFDFSEYPVAEELIKSGQFYFVNQSCVQTFPREYLEIMKFTDQHSDRYLVTVYDSDELWQDPQIIKIFVYPSNVLF